MSLADGRLLSVNYKATMLTVLTRVGKTKHIITVSVSR